MACPEGLEPPTYSLEGYCSIRLSYGQSLHRYGTDSAGAKRPIIPAGTARSTHENRGNTNAPAVRCVPARMGGTGRRGRGDGRAVRSRTGRRNVRTGGAGRHVHVGMGTVGLAGCVFSGSGNPPQQSVVVRWLVPQAILSVKCGSLSSKTVRTSAGRGWMSLRKWHPTIPGVPSRRQ